MMLKIKTKICFILCSLFMLQTFNIHPVYGSDSNIQKLDWDGVSVVFLEDNRFPTYDMAIYFADGALSDGERYGETEMMFDLLSSGTNRYEQKQISESLEFYGASISTNVNHEYSTFQVSGLVKDLVPTFKMICHVFSDAIYPEKEVKNHKQKIAQTLLNMASSPSALATYLFRGLSMQKTPYAHDSTGTIASIKKISSKSLKEKLSYFRDHVAKRIYITGPAQSLNLRSILLNECGLKKVGNEKSFVRSVDHKVEVPDVGGIYLIPIAESNQAEIRIGRFLAKDEITDPELLSLVAGYLGSGGITPKLMKELRQKRGLTYGASAVIFPQKEYGRVVIGTSTKVVSVPEVLTVIKSILDEGFKKEIAVTELAKTKNYLSGHFPFGLEKSSAYLGQLLLLDHVDKPYSDLYRYPEIVQGLSNESFFQSFKQVFDSPKMVTLIVGPKSLEAPLKAFGKVTVVDYKKML